MLGRVSMSTIVLFVCVLSVSCVRVLCLLEGVVRVSSCYLTVSAVSASIRVLCAFVGRCGWEWCMSYAHFRMWFAEEDCGFDCIVCRVNAGCGVVGFMFMSYYRESV